MENELDTSPHASGAFGTTPDTVRMGIQPVIVTITPGNVYNNEEVLITVVLDGQVPADQVVAITGSPGFWTILPESVTVLAFNTSITFPATVSSTASRRGSVTASCNGGSASGFAYDAPGEMEAAA